MRKFAVIILSHGRANNLKTVATLRRCGYSGKIYILLDDEDEQIEEYKKNKDVEIVVFCKSEEMQKTDTIDNFNKHKAVVYARNKCHEVARQLNLEYFLELDDDYSSFQFRYPDKNEEKLLVAECKNLDKVFESMLKFLDASGAVSVALAQGGDFIGGVSSQFWQKQISRKVMNSFFCRTDKPFKFLGSINEDVNAYVTLGQKGKLFFTVGRCMLVQTATQQSEGGLTDIYLDLGTYVKSFYSVICSPSCVKVCSMGVNYRRIHHRINADKCYPLILHERWKK